MKIHSVTRQIRDTARDALVRGILQLPDGLRLKLREQARVTKRMDYAREEIILDLESNHEFVYRVNSCSKEPETIEWIESFITEGDVLLDIGANVGAYSLVVAKRLKGKCTVYAFEPGFASYGQLCRNIMLNGCESVITPLPVALSNYTGINVMHYSASAAGAADHRIGGEQRLAGSASQNIMCWRLDELSERLQLQAANHMKIDVDGGEREVLLGAESVLANPALRSVLIEVDGLVSPVAEIHAIFERHGFKLNKCIHRHSQLANCIFVRDL